jgi:flagellar biosynthesis/type III secretory pathway ATPase
VCEDSPSLRESSKIECALSVTGSIVRKNDAGRPRSLLAGYTHRHDLLLTRAYAKGSDERRNEAIAPLQRIDARLSPIHEGRVSFEHALASR